MNEEIKKLYPQQLWEIFSNICSVPHPSKHEAKLTAALMDWAKKNKIDCKQDKTGNLIFSAPATKGMENCVPVILQGHVDMVPQANSDKKHDFTKDPIETRIENGWVRANGTTLGADNGVGTSAALAVLVSKDVAHGPIEVLATVDEETGMTGAFGLKSGVLNGKILINLDSETEGELYVGCAGGLDANFTMKYKEKAVPAGMKALKLFLTGLKGGHSGMDINLGRANANKLMTRLLKSSIDNYEAHVCCVNGGSLRNAIPREAAAIVVLPEDKVAAYKRFVKKFTDTVKEEFAATEPDMELKVTAVDTPKKMMDADAQKRIVNLVFAIPNGVQRMSDSMKDLVETSNNLAIFNAENGEMKVCCLLRSSVNSAKDALGQKMTAIAELAGADIELTGAYPGWKPNMESPILKTCMTVYKKKFGKEPAIMAIHAGLECGLFGSRYPDWDMISFGPTIVHPHSPDEKVNVESVGKFWDFLVDVLKNTPKKK